MKCSSAQNESSGKDEDLKFFNNAKYMPCLPKRTDGEPTYVSDICDIPSLHIYLGAGNKIWSEGETKCYGPFLEGRKSPWKEFEEALIKHQFLLSM